ncbi:hydantoinase/oxoprolinase family protein [Ramlibacter albus]|uniref:Hydantoinase/oxoprolinase family protein n=1 Tax=Ramlibacter albus TaxID=2079448 RepID=A0A923S5D4_9BURK|nr:hydantoinase/oxoprolinase family protein [Ramlibacter albus]MBC5767858.1 hydantoinase/oxoprolinase family protein [Ramlibacter albus]
MITVGSDIGGTFTDFVQVDEGTGRIEVYKTLTTPSDPSLAIDQGVRELAQRAGSTAKRIDAMVHGTTLVINAVIERKGARTGLITTRGFRDVLEIGREKRFDAYDLQIEFPAPLVPRRLRLEVDERMHASGEVLQPLDEASVHSAVQALIDADCESIAVCLLHSYANPAHERRVAQIVAEMAPQVAVTISSEVLPEMKEYERTSTTTLNAYAKPVTSRYLTKLEERVRAQGFAGGLLMMQSSGGINSVDFARQFPVQIIESGPAAGTLGAAHFARLADLDKVLAFDMGGTTAKLALVENGKALRTNDFEVAHMHRFKPGSGLPVRISVVDLIEIGAGGGSIAKRTPVGTLQVGPESSSAQPGPACYAQGGTLPTVSDADLVLGYLDAEHFLGGRMKLDREAAVEAIRKHLAEPLGITVEEAAFGVHAIVNENMASAAKAYTSEKGENPKSCALVGFGGAGPVHTCDLAARLAIETVLIPPRAGVAAAFGMIVAPVTYDAVRSRRTLLSRITPELLEQVRAELMAECRERMPSTVAPESITYEFSVDMRYVGQGYDVNAVLPAQLNTAEAAAAMQEAFERSYRKLYGRTFPVPLEVMNFRLSASASRKVIDLPTATTSESKGDGRVGSRRAFCARTKSWKDFSVHRRSAIAPGVHFAGPAIVEEDESTTVIHSDSYAHVDANGSLIIQLEPARSHA